MKNTRSSNGLYILLGIMLLGGTIGIFMVFYGMFYNLVKDEWRSAEVASAVVVFTAAASIAMFAANDTRSKQLARALAGGSIAVAGILYFGNLMYEAAGNDLAKLDETIAWIVPATVIVPVVCGLILWIRHSLDKYWGEDTLANSAGARSGFLNAIYTVLYNVGIVLALAGSALGTWAVASAITHSSFHSLVYVATVEIPILGYSVWNHRTTDKSMYWKTFAATCIGFGIAVLFQLANAGILIGGLNITKDDTISVVARNFYLLPPLVILGITGWLLFENQTKQFEPFGKGNRPAMPAPMSRNQFAMPAPMQTIRDDAPGLAVMVTSAMRESLLDLGYSNEEIDKMKPQEAQGRIKSQVLHNQRANGSDPKA